MKKFGTPIGAGPGSDSENVGFEVLGTPLPDGSLAAGAVFFFVALLFFALLFFEVLLKGVWPWLDDFSGDEDVGCGVVLDELVVVVLFLPGAFECEGEVEVELEVVVEEDDELEDDDEDEELEEDEEELEELDEFGNAVVVVVVVVAVAVVDDDDEEVAGSAQVIVAETAPGTLTGGMTPGVAFTGPTVCVPPPTSVTAIVHVSAEAIGMAARPRTTRIEAASSSTVRSLRLNVNLVRPLLPPSTCASHCVEIRCTSTVPRGTLLTGTEVCNFEPKGSRRHHIATLRARPREEERALESVEHDRTGQSHPLACAS
jgi:hypothetical protein